MPKRILWDLMDTVVVDPFFIHMPAFFGVTLQALIEQKDPSVWLEFERREVDEATLFARFFRDGRTFDGAALKAHIVSHYRFVPGMEALLSELHTAGVPMHALSNYPSWYRELDGRLGLRRYMGLEFISCETGVRKPHPEAYLRPCRELGVEPQTCVFIDDRMENVQAARELGMPALHFEGQVGPLREALLPLLARP